jgi:hypothetical protein
MGHHVPALPPPIMLPTPKTEQPRWRPRTHAPGTGAAKDLQEAAGHGAVAAAGDAPGKQPGRRPKAASVPRRAGATIQPLADETLRTVLIGQEDLRNGSG